MDSYAFLQIIIYFALLPVVFQLLRAVDLSKIFKKNYTFEIQVLIIFITIIITKLVGDFIINLMDLFRQFFGINS